MKRLAGFAIGLALAILSPKEGARALPLIAVAAQAPPIAVGADASIGIRASGFGSREAPSLGVYDIDVFFDPRVLAIESWRIGDPDLGDQLDVLSLGSFSSVELESGSINVFQVSLDAPDALNQLQHDDFLLFELLVSGVGVGDSEILVEVRSLGDAFGDPLGFSVAGAHVMVVPEPSAHRALLIGLLCLVALRAHMRKGHSLLRRS